jgi:hypothetical protein
MTPMARIANERFDFEARRERRAITLARWYADHQARSGAQPSHPPL